MAVTVPGKGWVSAVHLTGIATEYLVLGPLASGDYLRRVSFVFNADGVSDFAFCLSLGSSGEATAAALQSGAPLIQRSDEPYLGIPSITIRTVAGVPYFGWIPVGVSGEVGARYVVGAVSTKVLLVECTVLVGLDVLRVKAGGEGG